MFTDGDAEMDLLSDLLANGKVSRLYRALVYERRIASEVMAFQNSRELGGFWQLVATAAPGHTLDELQSAIDGELAALLESGPTPDEMERGHAQIEAQFVYRLQTLGGFGGKADQLNAYSVFLNDPAYFERDLARYQGVTADDLHRVARKYLKTDNRVALSVVPKGKLSLGLPHSTPAVVS
jgi:predicted Zn-dependent peptidase